MLKLTEGIFNNIFHLIQKNPDDESITTDQAALINNIENKFDYEEHGGTPILGIKGIVIKCHGSSTKKSIKQSIKTAKKLYEKKIITIIEENLSHQLDNSTK